MPRPHRPVRTKHSLNNKGEYTHKYIGPSTAWGLPANTECKIVGKKAGGKLIRIEGNTTVFLVNIKHLEKL